MPDRLILVRHGESTWNAEERLQGQLDPPLSERGREQARTLVGGGRRAACRAGCVQRPRARARDRRADGIGARAAGSALARDRRRRVGRPYRGGDRRAGRGAHELARWSATAAGGEPWDAFALRVAGAVDELVAAGGPWLVVCHGGCIRAAAAHVTGADGLHLGSPPNASLTVFELGERPRLLVYGSLPDGGLPTGLY